jgi:hypothetical protein
VYYFNLLVFVKVLRYNKTFSYISLEHRSSRPTTFGKCDNLVTHYYLLSNIFPVVFCFCCDVSGDCQALISGQTKVFINDGTFKREK